MISIVDTNQTESISSKTLSWPNHEDNTCCRRMRWQLVSDTIISIGVIALIVCTEFGFVPQRNFGFRCKDPSISFPYYGDTITAAILILGSLGLASFVFAIVEFIRVKSYKICFNFVWMCYKQLIMGIGFVGLLTEIMKLVVGEHRPDFLYVCGPDKNFNCEGVNYIEDYVCTNKQFSHFFLNDASRSFPSGHSSTSVFVSLFCTYMVQTRLPSAVTGKIFKLFLIAACLTWCILCSLTRITDRRHHWWDVLCGASLGAICAIYFLIFLSREIRRHQEMLCAKCMKGTFHAVA